MSDDLDEILVSRGDTYNFSSVEKLVKNYSPELKEKLEKFQDLKFGFFIHWGLWAKLAIIESWAISIGDEWARNHKLFETVYKGDDGLKRFIRDYKNLNRSFNPQSFDPKDWVKIAKEAGTKYLTFTTKHHDGFCMFDTKTTSYKITDPSCPYSFHPKFANVTKAVFDAFREENFWISCYFSKADWHTPYYWNPNFPIVNRNNNYDKSKYPELWELFTQYTHAQIRELMRDYGKIDCLWLDGGQVAPPKQDIRMYEIAKFSRELQGNGLLMVDRTIGGEFENVITPEHQIPSSPLFTPWESCLTIGTSFAYTRNEEFKSPAQLIKILTHIVAMGGNLLLGIGPDAEGEIDPRGAKAYKEIGRYLAKNGEAIYETRIIEPYKLDQIYFTQNPKTSAIYIHIDTSQGIQNSYGIPKKFLKAINKISHLASSKEAKFDQRGDFIRLSFEKEFIDEKYKMSVFKLI